MKINKHHQSGLANSTIFFLIVIIAFTLWVFFKLFPLYLENRKVTQVLDDMKGNSEALQKDLLGLKRMLKDGLVSKDVKSISEENFDEQVKITKTEQGFEIVINYQQKAPITGHLYFLNEVEKTVEAP